RFHGAARRPRRSETAAAAQQRTRAGPTPPLRGVEQSPRISGGRTIPLRHPGDLLQREELPHALRVDQSDREQSHYREAENPGEGEEESEVQERQEDSSASRPGEESEEGDVRPSG